MPAGIRESVEAAYAALNRGDVDSFIALLDPEAVWEWPKGMIDTDTFRGPEGARRGMRAFHESWGELHYVLDEVLEGDDEVFAIVRYVGSGRVSGIPVDELVAHLWEFKGRRVVRLRMFADAAKARRRFLEER